MNTTSNHQNLNQLGCTKHCLKKPEAVRVANGEILPITHYARLYLKMGNITIHLSLHITKSTGDIILGYPFLTRFELLIHWKDRYMEIMQQGSDYKFVLV